MSDYPLFAHFRQKQDFNRLIYNILEGFPEWVKLETESFVYTPYQQNDDEFIDVLLRHVKRKKPKNLHQSLELKSDVYTRLEITPTLYVGFCSSHLNEQKTLFWIDYTPVSKNIVTRSGQKPKIFLSAHEKAIKNLLTHIIEGCGAELAYITLADKNWYLPSASYNPFNLSERVDKLMASSKNILTELIRSENANSMWSLALKRDIFENEYQQNRKKLDEIKLIPAGKTESVAILEKRVKATNQPDIWSPLYEVYKDLGLITD